MELIADLAKLHEEERVIHARALLEQPDRANEIVDYEEAKKAFQAWSDEVQKASQGKSLGNVRVMHQKQVAGRVVDITFDDTSRAIDVAIKVDDPMIWSMCKAGAYTGLSIGGRYGKKWKDPTDERLTRYAPVVSELSIVDRPCMPGATFQVLKADGVYESRPFMPEVGHRIEFLEGVQWGGSTRFGTVCEIKSGCIFVKGDPPTADLQAVPVASGTLGDDVEGMGWWQLSRDHAIDFSDGLWRISPRIQDESGVPYQEAVALIGKDDGPKSFSDLYKAAGKDGRAGRDGDGDGVLNEGKDGETSAPNTATVEGHRERRSTDEGYRAATTGVIQEERGKAIGSLGGGLAGLVLGTAAGYEFFRPGSVATDTYFKAKEKGFGWAGNKVGRLAGSMAAQAAIGAETISRKAFRMKAANKAARETTAEKVTDAVGRAAEKVTVAGVRTWNKGAHALFSGWDRGGVRAFGNPHVLRTLSGATVVGAPAAYGGYVAGEYLGGIWDSFFPRRVAKSDSGDNLFKWGGAGFDESKVRRDDRGRFTFKDGAMIAGGAVAAAALGAAAGYMVGKGRSAAPKKRKTPAAAPQKPNAITATISSAATRLKNAAIDAIYARKPGEKVLPSFDEAVMRHARSFGSEIADTWKKTSTVKKVGLAFGAGTLLTNYLSGKVKSVDLDFNPEDDGGVGVHVKLKDGVTNESASFARVKVGGEKGSGIELTNKTPTLSTSYKPGQGLTISGKTAVEQAQEQNRQLQSVESLRDKALAETRASSFNYLRNAVQRAAFGQTGHRIPSHHQAQIEQALFERRNHLSHEQLRTILKESVFTPNATAKNIEDYFTGRIGQAKSGNLTYRTHMARDIDVARARALIADTEMRDRAVALFSKARVSDEKPPFDNPASSGTPGRDGRAGRDGDGDGKRNESQVNNPPRTSEQQLSAVHRERPDFDSLVGKYREKFWTTEGPGGRENLDFNDERSAEREKTWATAKATDEMRRFVPVDRSPSKPSWQPTINLDAQDEGEDIADALRRGYIIDKLDGGELRKDGRAGRDGDGDGVRGEGEEKGAGRKSAPQVVRWKDIGAAAGAGAGWFLLDQIAGRVLRPVRAGAGLASRLSHLTRRGAIGSGGSLAGGAAGAEAGSHLDRKGIKQPKTSVAEETGKLVGNLVGQSVGVLGGAAAGAVGGPAGVFAGGLVGSSAGTVAGEQLGAFAGRMLDRWASARA